MSERFVQSYLTLCNEEAIFHPNLPPKNAYSFSDFLCDLCGTTKSGIFYPYYEEGGRRIILVCEECRSKNK
jgi:hypothetical protein